MEILRLLSANLLSNQESRFFFVSPADDKSPSDDASDPLLRCLDLSRLRSREVDALSSLFSLWSRAPPSSAEEEEDEDKADAAAEAARPDLMDRFWDSRLRALLRDRFDVREGLFEMDYQLRLVERGGAAVSHREYCHWRKTGEAFAFNEAVDLGN